MKDMMIQTAAFFAYILLTTLALIIDFGQGLKQAIHRVTHPGIKRHHRE